MFQQTQGWSLPEGVPVTVLTTNPLTVEKPKIKQKKEKKKPEPKTFEENC